MRVALMRVVFSAAAFLCAMAGQAHGDILPWHVTKTEWTAADEKGFGEFVKSIALTDCKTTVECMKGPGNPYRDTDPETLEFHADCAKWVYMLRAYYAWKHGLPFSYIDHITGTGPDLRFTATSNATKSRHDLLDFGLGIPAESTLKDLHDQVWTATYRMDPANEAPLVQDFYSPKIQPGSIHAGTAIYDINGHVGLVYDVTEDGRILYMDAHPDETVSRSVYGPQFGQSSEALGGGFKNFRPLKLVGAAQGADGTLIGGHVELAANKDIPDYSLEQYRGNAPGTKGDGTDAQFAYKNANLGLFEYARASMSGGKYSFNPAYELQTSLQSLCHDLHERVIHVDMAANAGIWKKAQPEHLPGAGNAAESAEWDAYATLPMDARLKNSFAQLYGDMQQMILLWQQRDPRIVDAGTGESLKLRLQKIYAQESKACAVRYMSSEGKATTLTLAEVSKRLFALDFDPYHCVERRWGASAEELKSCKDADIKVRWYKAEQPLRYMAEGGFAKRDAQTLPELESAPMPAPPPTDVQELIDGMGEQVPFQGMRPVGL